MSCVSDDFFTSVSIRIAMYVKEHITIFLFPLEFVVSIFTLNLEQSKFYLTIKLEFLDKKY